MKNQNTQDGVSNNQSNANIQDAQHTTSSNIIANIQHGTENSFKTITSITNTMVGSTLIVFPIVFIQDGMIGSLIALIIIGTALFFTCRCYVVHHKEQQQDYTVTIERILGQKWAKLNMIVNFTLLYITSIGYFMLICGNFYDITSSIAEQISQSYKPPQKSSIVLDSYSMQYASLISVLFTAPFIFMRSIQFIMKFFKFTIYLVFAYGIFILAGFIKVIAAGELQFERFHSFTSDFSTIAGTFALSFLIHPIAAPILKRNINPKNNLRDLLLGYILTGAIYVFIGFVGGLTCSVYAEDIFNDTKGNYRTVFDCYTKEASQQFFIVGKIVQFGIFIQNLSVMPILSFLTRKDLLTMIKNQKMKQTAFYIYNISITLFCFIVTFFNINVSVIMSLNGAIVGFFMAYALPIATQLASYHSKSAILKSEQKQTLLDIEQMDEENEQLSGQVHNKKRSLVKDGLIYGGLLILGLGVAIFKIYALFK